MRIRVPGRPSQRAPHATIVATHPRRRVVLPFAPVASTRDGISPAWTQLPRPGRNPLLLGGGGQLKVYTTTVTVAALDWHVSVQAELNALERIAESGDAVTFTYGGPERGRWRITGCSYDVVVRTPSGQAAQALLHLQLTEASDPVGRVGPASGGRRSHPKPHHKPAGRSAAATDRPHPGAPARVTITAGDTLAAIAGRVYGDPNDWHRIADANGIRDPRVLRAGRVLIVP